MKRIFLPFVLSALLGAGCAEEAAFNELEETGTPRSTEYGPGFWTEDKSLVEKGHEETRAPLLSPQQLEDWELQGFDLQALFRFSQTQWNECASNPSGNYYTVGCTPRRAISVILNDYLNRHLLACVDEGLEAQGGGRAAKVHIEHAGITGDRRHSPRSLHAENRAIDIKVLSVRLSNGQDRKFTYALTGNRPFYTALRRCWGERVNRENGCPLQSGQTLYTGSIGWEDKNHGAHMHLSVPYCLNGRYGTGFFQR